MTRREKRWARRYEDYKAKGKLKISCEDSAVEYVDLLTRRLIYRNGIYQGWYKA